VIRSGSTCWPDTSSVFLLRMCLAGTAEPAEGPVLSSAVWPLPFLDARWVPPGACEMNNDLGTGTFEVIDKQDNLQMSREA